MGRFLSLTVFFVLAASVLLHRQVEVAYVGDWLGRLPGDVIIKKNGMVFHLPFMSALLASSALSLFFSLFSSRKD